MTSGSKRPHLVHFNQKGHNVEGRMCSLPFLPTTPQVSIHQSSDVCATDGGKQSPKYIKGISFSFQDEWADGRAAITAKTTLQAQGGSNSSPGDSPPINKQRGSRPSPLSVLYYLRGGFYRTSDKQVPLLTAARSSSKIRCRKHFISNLC